MTRILFRGPFIENIQSILGCLQLFNFMFDENRHIFSRDFTKGDMDITKYKIKIYAINSVLR